MAEAVWFDPRSEGREAGRLGLAVVLALATHGMLSFVRTEAEKPAREASNPWSLIDVSEEPAPKAEPDPPEPPESDPIRSVSASVRGAVPGPSSASPPAGAAGPDGPNDEPSDAAPVETSEFSDADWAISSGSGTTLGGARTASRFGGGGVARSGTLAARDLSREALAPDLSPLVERNFPQIARMYHVEGKVTVSAVLDENGTPSDVRVDSVNPEGRGFGEACARTVHQGPKWRPKLNRDGRPVATTVTYTCSFRLPKDVSHTESTEGTSKRIWTRSAD